MKEKCKYLPALDVPDRRVNANDPVHWTMDTADKILETWLNSLN